MLVESSHEKPVRAGGEILFGNPPDLAGARDAFLAYRDVSTRLAAREPDNVDYTLELIYAASNLGSVAREGRQSEDALRYFADAVALNERLLATDPDDPNLRYDLAEGLSWLGTAQLDMGNLAESESSLLRSHGLMRELHDLGARARHREGYGDVSVQLSEVQAHRGDFEAATRSLEIALEVFSQLVELDPDNARWQIGLARVQYLQGTLYLSTGRPERARPALELAYQLAAGTDEDTERVRNEVIVIIDPLQNPDGRTRWLEWSGQVQAPAP